MTRYRQVHDLWHVLYAPLRACLARWRSSGWRLSGLPKAARRGWWHGHTQAYSERRRQHVRFMAQSWSNVDLMSVYYERSWRSRSLSGKSLGLCLCRTSKPTTYAPGATALHHDAVIATRTSGSITGWGTAVLALYVCCFSRAFCLSIQNETISIGYN